MEGKRGSDLQALTEIADNDVLIVDTGGGTRKITYGALCAAVKNTLGIREVVESTNITEPGFLMDGKTASEAFAELYSKLYTTKMDSVFLGSVNDINNYYNSVSTDITPETHYIRTVTHGVGHPILGGGNFFLEGYKSHGDYEWQKLCLYDITGVSIHARSKISGTWNDWVKTT